MAKFLYWLPEHGMTREDPFEVDTECRHPRDIAGDAARNYHSKHDGWEAHWPLRITVELQNGAEHTFEVYREMSPVFFAIEITNSAQGKSTDGSK